MSDDISHYGVKGMKWGVRRDQSTLDRLAGRVGSGAKAVGLGARRTAVAAGRSAQKRRQRSSDRIQRSAKKHEARGHSREKALAIAQRNQKIKNAVAVAAATYAVDLAIKGASGQLGTVRGNLAGVQNVARARSKAKAGERATAALFSDSRGIASFPTVRLNSSEYSWD